MIRDIVISIFICCVIGAMLMGLITWGMKESYNKGFYDGYHKYIETFIPAPYLPKKVPVKTRNRNLIEKFKG